MNKRDMIDTVRTVTGCTLVKAQAAVEGILGGIIEAAFDGEKVNVRGFGTFTAKTFKAREFRNPAKAGATVKVSERKVLKFKASALIRR